MKQIKSILLGISLFLLHSCNLLDVDTVSSITGAGYWNTKGDVESYLIGIYTKLRATQKYIYPLMQYASANSLFLSDSTPKLIPGVYFNNILQC